MKINPAAVKAIRERSGVTQAKLAELADIDTGAMSKIESGQRNATLAQAAAIAVALKVPLVAIIADVEVVSPAVVSW